MLILPLGLGTKLRRMPIVTLMLASVWIGAFVVDRSEQKITDGIFAAAAKTGVRDAARKLFVDYCLGKHGKPSLCERYAVLIRTGFPHKTKIRDGVPELSKKDFEGLGNEQSHASTLRDRFSHCGASPLCFKYKEMVWSFSAAQPFGSPAVKLLSTYSNYVKAEQRYLAELRRMCLNAQCLVRGNINLGSVAWSQLRHGSLSHLLGNLLAFLIFGIYAEQRTNRLLYLAIILLGGSLGMIVHTQFFAGYDTIALGASANVSAVMGMFYVFFFHSRMRFLVWLPRRIYLGSSFFAEVRYCFPLFFVLADIAGGLDNGFSGLRLANVAHMAHVTGFLLGVLGALAIVNWRRLPKTFIYESELDDLRRLEGIRSLGMQLAFANRMLERNPENLRVREIGCAAALRWIPQNPVHYGTSIKAQISKFLRDHLATFCAMNTRAGNVALASQFVERLPVTIPYQLFLANAGQKTILTLANFSVTHANPWVALRLYDLFLMKYPLSSSYERVESYCADLISQLADTTANMRSASSYLKLHLNSPLAARFGAWLSNLELRSA